MSLLAVASWNEFFGKFISQGETGYEVLQKVFSILSVVLWVVLGIVGAVGSIYAIYLGIRLARAEDQSKRDEAKKHLITVAIAVGVTVVLILFFNTFLPMLLDAFGVANLNRGGTSQEGEESIITLLSR